MIRYDLTCDHGHRFDGWFRSSGDFDAQSGRGLLECPNCGSSSISKALMAPALTRSRGEVVPTPAPENPGPGPGTGGEGASQPVALLSEREARLRAMLRELHTELTRDSVDVGNRFADEARKMHYGEAEKGSIYGQASLEDARALTEEGIQFLPLPGLPDDRN